MAYQLNLPVTNMKVFARIIENGNTIENNVFEGEATMSQEQQDKYKALIGDGLAKISVGRDLANKDFGNGGGVLVNVTLSCDQSEGAIQQAIGLAYEITNSAAWYYQEQIMNQLRQKGILR